MLDGGFVLIFEKLNENDERETKEGVLAPSIFFTFASGSVLKLLGLLVKMIKPSNIKHPNHKFEKLEVAMDTSTTTQFSSMISICSQS